MLARRYLGDIQKTQQEIESRFKRSVRDPQPAQVTDAHSACLLTLQSASMKLGQLARAKLPREEVESVTPREFRHGDALLLSFAHMHAHFVPGAHKQWHHMRSFERVHPALADAHYLRTRDEDERLRTARMEVERLLHMAWQSAPWTERNSRRLPVLGAVALPALQLPDWDRVAAPQTDSPAFAQPHGRPVSTDRKTEAVTALASPGSRVGAELVQVQILQPTAQHEVHVAPV